MALAQLEGDLKEAHRREIEALVEDKNTEMHDRLEELRQKLIESSQINVERILIGIGWARNIYTIRSAR